MRAPYTHEGGTIWSWDSYMRLAARLRVQVSPHLTPTTEEYMQTPPEIGVRALTHNYRAKMLRARQCPAKHPVVAMELRAEMASLKTMIQTFPNHEGSPYPYLPIPFFLCVTCQAVYRLRECDEVPGEEVADAPGA